MRLLHTFDDQQQAAEFCAFLTKEGIENQCEIIANTDWGSADYGTVKGYVWVVEEDQVEIATRWLDEYLSNRQNPIFQTVLKQSHSFFDAVKNPSNLAPPPPTPPPRSNPDYQKGLGRVTLYLLMTCTLLFLYGEYSSPTYDVYIPSLPGTPLYSPPINKKLLYDYPQKYEILDKLVSAYGYQKLQNAAELPLDGKLLMQKFEQTPYWEGFYDKVVNYLALPEKPWNFNAPLFEKIREGEIWRLFTPCLLHLNAFHLFFNMIWLVVLGKLIEERIGSLRFLLLVVIVAVVSNTLQYLMSGPNFIGISGVICGMLGFIWARQQRAVWEGYNLLPGVISFMFFFVMSMFTIQIISFFLQVYMHHTFMPGIANTAHIVGGLTGYLLGCLNVSAIKTKV